MAEKRGITREEHLRNRAYIGKLPPFRSDMSEEDLKKWFSRARATGSLVNVTVLLTNSNVQLNT